MKVRSIRHGASIKAGEWVAYKFEVGVSQPDTALVREPEWDPDPNLATLPRTIEIPRYWIDDTEVERDAFESARSITRG